MARVLVTYSPEVGGASVISLKQSFIGLGSEVIDGDYRAMMRDIPKEEFDRLYQTVEGREILFAHAKAKAIKALDDVDVLVLSGNNSMIDPALFSNGREEGVGYDFSRTIAELALIHVATQRGMPIIGICGGHQAIAVYGGGEISTMSAEQLDKQKFMNYDKVKFHADSMLAKIIAGNPHSASIKAITVTINKLKAQLRVLKKFQSLKLGPLSFKEAMSPQELELLSGLIEITATSKTIAKKIALVKKELHKATQRLRTIQLTSEDDCTYEFFGAHNQAVSKTPSGFVQVGVASDEESIEALEAEHGSPVIGTQFHPEVGVRGLPSSDFLYRRDAADVERNLDILRFINNAGEAYRRKRSVLSQIKALRADKITDEDKVDTTPCIKPSSIAPVKLSKYKPLAKTENDHFILIKAFVVTFKLIISAIVFVCKIIAEYCRSTLGKLMRDIVSHQLTAKKVSCLKEKEKAKIHAVDLKKIAKEEMDDKPEVESEKFDAIDEGPDLSVSAQAVLAPCVILRDVPAQLWTAPQAHGDVVEVSDRPSLSIK